MEDRHKWERQMHEVIIINKIEADIEKI